MTRRFAETGRNDPKYASASFTSNTTRIQAGINSNSNKGLSAISSSDDVVDVVAVTAPKKGIFQRVRRFVGGVFRRDREPETKPSTKQTNKPAPRPDEPFTPRGVFGVASIVVRRYLFNLWDPTPRNWAYAVRQDGKDKSGGLYAKSFYIENKMRRGRLVSVRKPKKTKVIRSVVGGAVSGVRRAAGGAVGGVLSLFGGGGNNNQDVDALNEIDVDAILIEDDFSDDEVRIFASRLNVDSRSNIQNQKRQFALRIPSLPLPSVQIPNLGQNIGRRLGGIRSAVVENVPKLIPFRRNDETKDGSAKTVEPPSSTDYQDFNSPFKLGSDSGGFVSKPGDVRVVAMDRFANRSERKDTEARQMQTALGAVSQRESLPSKDGSSPAANEQEKSWGFNPAEMLVGVWSAASSVTGGAFKAVGDARAGLNISLPWDVYYRGDIPFFENTVSPASGGGKVIDDNLVSQVMAVDAVEAAAPSIVAVPPSTHFPVISDSGVSSLNVVKVSDATEKPTDRVVSRQETGGRLSKVAFSIFSNVFPLISTGVQAVTDLRRRTVDTLDSGVADEQQAIDAFYQVNSVTDPGPPAQDIGLGLGLDPAYVARVRQSVESLSAREPDQVNMPSDSVSSDPISSSVSNSQEGATAKASQSLLSTIYMYTARPIIQAPGTVYEWGRSRFMGSTAASVGVKPSTTAISAFDEEAEALRQELRDAVRAREVLPASVLDNAKLEEYNPVAEKQAKTAPAQILTQVLLDQTKELTSVITTPAAAAMAAATDFAYRGAGYKPTTAATSTTPVVVTDEKKSPSIDFGSLASTSGFSASVSTTTATPTSATTEVSKLTISADQTDSSLDAPTEFSGSANRDLRAKPQFVEKERVPIPTKADFAYIESRSVLRAISAALSIANERDAKEFLKDVGLQILLRALEEYSVSAELRDYRSDVVKGICRLMRMEKSVADILAQRKGTMDILIDMMEAPMRGSFRSFRMSAENKDKEERSQREAVALVLRMVRSSDVATDVLRTNPKLRNVLSQIVAQSEIVGASTASPYISDAVTKVAPPTEPTSTAAGLLSYVPFFSSKPAPVTATSAAPKMLVRGNTTIVDYPNLKTSQMARVASWALGGVAWKPKQPGQKGLRILSLDGGGTRGVLSIALIKELMKRIGKQHPHEVFDIICGTSTGGIIACLLGLQMRSIQETETLYDDLIDRVFGKKSNLKLVSEQAMYDELEFERILYSLCGEELLLDSNRNNCARVFVASTKVNNNPPIIQLWRNYNYPPEQRPRYTGSFRINTLTAVRATTAAPTFFTPVPWNGGLYCDGALVANNPTAIALQEAKVRYIQFHDAYLMNMSSHVSLYLFN